GGFTHAHVHDDLDQTRHLHRVGVLELLAQLRHDLVAVPLLQTRHDLGFGSCGHHSSLPLLRAMRIFRPFSSNRYPTRVGLPSESRIITFETWIGASCVMIPPVFAPRWVVRIRSCFLIRFTPSTRTFCSRGKAARTLPLAPLSLPAMTMTVSPFLIFTVYS